MNIRVPSQPFLVFILCCFCWYKFKQIDLHEHEASHSTSIDVPVTQEIQESHHLNHLACIMDGNRRWAKQRGLSSTEGHRKGIEMSKLIIEFCLEKKIPYLSLYIFSNENFKVGPGKN